jgi:hypothetical protein
MAQTRKTTEELIAEEQKKAEQVRTRMAELKSRQRVEERKRDNHRKIVVGAGVMAHIRIDPQAEALGACRTALFPFFRSLCLN